MTKAKGKRIGTVLHGALGDCYEQILCMQKYKERNPADTLIAFFEAKNRYKAYQYFDLSVFDEIYDAEKLQGVIIDKFYQFQIKDIELQEKIISKLPLNYLNKFDLNRNILPWSILRKHNFSNKPLTLELNSKGLRYLEVAKEIDGVSDDLFRERFVTGFLWRYRENDLRNSHRLYTIRFIKRNLEDVFNHLIHKHNAHIIIAGMSRGGLSQLGRYREIVEEAGLGLGEHRNKFADFGLDIDEQHLTYLKGIGYAVEMEMMSKCNLLLTMPSGFSEPLWMRQKQPVVMLYPPLRYIAALSLRRVPFFDNNKMKTRVFNTFMIHSSRNILKHLSNMGYLPINYSAL